MSYFPYPYHRDNQMNSFIRFFHTVPNAPAVDVYANGNPIVRNLAYKQLSPYIPAAPGSYNITVYPAGQTTNPVVSRSINIPANTVSNAAVIGTLPNISLYLIPEPSTGQNFGRPCIRFIHLSPNAPAVDLKLSDGTVVFDNVSYKDISNYACIPAGTYTFTVSPTGTNNAVLTLPNVILDSNKYYTIYAVGLAGGTPSLEALPVLEPRP